MPRVAVIIPVLNNWELTQDCLKHLAAHTPDQLDTGIVVMDNGSDDPTHRDCPLLGQSLFGARFTYLRVAHNRNFGPACTMAAQQTSADLLLFLNNDTQVGPDWLPPLVCELERDDVAGVGPLLTYPDGDVQHLGIAFWPGGGGVAHLYRNIAATHPLATRRRRFQALTAAALLVRRRDFFAVGGFDEGYVNGFEDVDLGLRLTADGRHMTCVPESRVVHLESRTPRRKAHDAANSARLAAMWPLAQHGDLPALVAADGYCLRVLPDLELSIDLPEERQRELMHRLKPFDPVRCYELLQQEPFWSQGYGLLGVFLERQGLVAEAAELYVRQFQTLLAPAPEEYDRLRRALRAVGQDTARVDAGMARQRAAICDPAYATRLAACLAACLPSSQASRQVISQASHLAAESAPGASSAHARGSSGEDTPLTALIPRYHAAAAEAERLRMAWK